MRHDLASYVTPVWIANENAHRDPQLLALVTQAASSGWDPEVDLPWDIDVDPERVAVGENRTQRAPRLDVEGTAASSWGPKEWAHFAEERRAWQLSQFLHGEQAALLCAARIVETCPWPDGRAVAATQVADESRHVTAFSRYVTTKLGHEYALSDELEGLFADILTDQRWDVIQLGMQVLVEGLALTGFGRLVRASTEPLLTEMLKRILGDEARHVAFGLVSLAEVYGVLGSRELRERQEFALDAILRLVRQQFRSEIWEQMGLSPADAAELTRRSSNAAAFGRELLARVLPNCRRLGLLDANDAWLARRLVEADISVSNLPGHND